MPQMPRKRCGAAGEPRPRQRRRARHGDAGPGDHCQAAGVFLSDRGHCHRNRKTLEHRHIIAYGLIAAILVVGSVFAVIYSRRRTARRRRLRGIKDYN